MECIITVVSNMSVAENNNLTEGRDNCNIMQRDFLNSLFRRSDPGGFISKYKDQYQIAYKSRIDARGIAECADVCISDPSCHVFYSCGFCEWELSESCRDITNCYYPSTIHWNRTLRMTKDNPNNFNFRDHLVCVEYQRDYFKEFDRITDSPDSRDQKTISLGKFTGRTLEECAHTCASVLSDCHGFQFCGHDTGDESLDVCEMFQETDQSIMKTKKPSIFRRNPSCPFYILRKNSVKAQLKQLAMADGSLPVIIRDETREVNNQTELGTNYINNRDSALVLFYLTMILLSFSILAIVYKATHYRLVRGKMQKVKQVLLRNPSRIDDSSQQSPLELNPQA